jgi:hypothetical protein
MLMRRTALSTSSPESFRGVALAALGDGNIFQRFDATELFGDFGCRGNFTLRDDGNRPKSYGQEVNQGLASF